MDSLTKKMLFIIIILTIIACITIFFMLQSTKNNTNDEISTSMKSAVSIPINYPMSVVVKTDIQDVLTGNYYSENEVKIGYYKSDDGFIFSPLNNYTDVDGLHIDLSNSNGIFYIVPVIQNNTSLYIAPVQTTYKNLSILSFDFTNIPSILHKHWVFKSTAVYLTDNHINHVKIMVFSYGEPVMHNYQNQTKFTGISTRAENKTVFSFSVDMPDCTVIPITGIRLNFDSPDTVNWSLEQSKLRLAKDLEFTLKDFTIYQDYVNTHYDYQFSYTTAKNDMTDYNHDGLAHAYYYLGKCIKRETDTPVIDNIITTFFPSNYFTMNATESIFYELPNGVQKQINSSVLLCASKCYPNLRDLS